MTVRGEGSLITEVDKQMLKLKVSDGWLKHLWRSKENTIIVFEHLIYTFHEERSYGDPVGKDAAGKERIRHE